jgi:hypothetical protein
VQLLAIVELCELLVAQILGEVAGVTVLRVERAVSSDALVVLRMAQVGEDVQELLVAPRAAAVLG